MFEDWQEVMQKKMEEEREGSKLIMNADGTYELNGVMELTSSDWDKVKEKIFSRYKDDTLEF